MGQFQIDNANELYIGKPGLTGLWFTESIDLKDKEEIKKLNIFYARNQNIWLDFEILGKHPVAGRLQFSGVAKRHSQAAK